MAAMPDTLDMTRQALDEALSRGAVVLTVNQRLSRRLSLDYAAARQAAGDACWPTPQIMPWSSWLQKVWTDTLAAGNIPGTSQVLLNSLQTRLLWEQVIRDSRLDKGVLNIPATAAGIDQAWSLMHAWHLELPAAQDYPNEDAAAFRVWALAFRRVCNQLKAIDSARLPDQIAALCGRSLIQLPGQICLLGFDEPTPQQRALWQVIGDQGCKIEQIRLSAANPDPRRIHCHDSQEELAQAAGWARGHLTDDANAQIGIVVPDLHARRAQVQRIFDDVLHPGQVLPGGTGVQRCYNISLGAALASYPMIGAALNILRLAQGRIEAHELGRLLRSPYTGAGQREAAGRALLDVRLRERGDYEVWLADMLGVARRAQVADAERVLAPEFLQQLERLFVLHRATTGKFHHHQWAERFTACLQAMNWPGERGLNSEEHQQFQAWQDLLDDFSSLDVIGPAIPVAVALSRLNHLAKEKLFQPRSGAQQLQILGLLEASGQRFDHLWVCGMDDESWPPPVRPNPWLPLAQQRRHQLPHATAESELEFARTLTREFSHAAADVVFSHAVWDTDRERRPSPLIAEFPEAGNIGHADVHLLRDLINATGASENLEDEQAPGITGRAVRGGSGLIAAQAACPFQAFARYRLQARALEEVSVGPDARQRGLLLHQAMQKIWSSLNGSIALRSKSKAALAEIVAAALDEVLSNAVMQRPRTYTPRFVEVEKRVLGGLISDWLAIEATRDEFTVAEVEQIGRVRLEQLELRVVMDRIDTDRHGAAIILDYKTGRVSASGWDGDRPDAPQLPMYALALEQAPAAVAFAQIRPGDSRFVGCGSEQASLPGIAGEPQSEWASRIDMWRETLSALAGEFRRGSAAVAPKNYPQTCRYCDLTPLCRVHEHAETGEDDIAGNAS